MKAFNFFLVAAITGLVVLFSACEGDYLDNNGGGETPDDCHGMGTMQVTNKSVSTLQRLMIDGVSYGTLDPGETKSVKLAAGYHNWQLVGIQGGGGCSDATVIIVECETTAFSCSGK